MDKNEILDILKKYSLDNKEFVVISSAALVIQGVKERTNDIDITTSDYLYNKLLNDYDCILEKKIGKYFVWYIDETINFSDHYYNNVEYIICDGYRVQTLDSVLELKKKLNRDKDKLDIELILNYKNSSKS